MTEVVWFAFIAFSLAARTVAYPAMARFRYSLAFNPAFSVARASVELDSPWQTWQVGVLLGHDIRRFMLR